MQKGKVSQRQMSKDAKDSGIVPIVEEIQLVAACTLSAIADDAGKWSQEPGRQSSLQKPFPRRITPVSSPRGLERSGEGMGA